MYIPYDPALLLCLGDPLWSPLASELLLASGINRFAVSFNLLLPRRWV